MKTRQKTFIPSEKNYIVKTNEILFILLSLWNLYCAYSLNLENDRISRAYRRKKSATTGNEFNYLL